MPFDTINDYYKHNNNLKLIRLTKRKMENGSIRYLHPIGHNDKALFLSFLFDTFNEKMAPSLNDKNLDAAGQLTAELQSLTKALSKNIADNNKEIEVNLCLDANMGKPNEDDCNGTVDILNNYFQEFEKLEAKIKVRVLLFTAADIGTREKLSNKIEKIIEDQWSSKTKLDIYCHSEDGNYAINSDSLSKIKELINNGKKAHLQIKTSRTETPKRTTTGVKEQLYMKNYNTYSFFKDNRDSDSDESFEFHNNDQRDIPRIPSLGEIISQHLPFNK